MLYSAASFQSNEKFIHGSYGNDYDNYVKKMF